MSQSNANGASFMEKLSTFIVDKRSLIFLITIIGLIFSAVSRNWVEVENDLTYYLPDDSQTKQALAVMNEEFITYGTAELMVANVTPAQAEKLADQIREVEGVQSVDYDETNRPLQRPVRPVLRHLRLRRERRRLSDIAGGGEGAAGRL